MKGKSSEEVSGLEDHVGYWLRFVSNHVSQGFQRKMEANGVTVSEWVILRELYLLEPTSPSALVHVTGLTKGAISKLITRLEAKKLLTRRVLLQDQRNHQIELSQKARLLVPILARLADDNDIEFFGHLTTNQRRELILMMKRMVRIHKMKEIPQVTYFGRNGEMHIEAFPSQS